ncbi:MAG TPA: hypothetical protein VLY63_07780 [Anaerolineae bacterium]|nr:hypothetical protein [Anaerolineae bacterium]
MRTKDTLTWFVRGFALTLLIPLVVLALAWPSLGWTQGEESVPPAPPLDNSAPRSNQEAMVSADPSPYAPEPAAAQQSEAGDYTSPLIIPAADFSSDGQAPGGFLFDFAGGHVKGATSACLKAPAYLPDEATVQGVYASLYDNAPGEVTVILRRVSMNSGVGELMAVLSTDVDTTTNQHPGTSSISHPVVDHLNYAYYLTTCLNSADHRLYSVRIYYAAGQ